MKHNRGFTLIEVLVVVAIIALLITILMPALAESRRISKRTVCLGNLEQIRVALQSYIQANRDTFPFVAQYPLKEAEIAKTSIPPRVEYPALPLALKNEMRGNSKAFECPSDEIRIESMVQDPQIIAGGWHRYYDVQRTSYEFMPWLCGRKLQPRTMSLLMDLLQAPLKRIPVVYDIEVFHGEAKKLKTFNAMYADFDVRSDQK